MIQLLLQLGKDNKVCNNTEEAIEFISNFGHLTSAGKKRLEGLFSGRISIHRDFAWMMPKHIPELKNYPEQSCRMWVKPYPKKEITPISLDEVRKAVEGMGYKKIRL